jgi:hypothetical protein
VVAELAVHRADLEVRQPRRAQDRGGRLRAGHAVARRDLRVALEGGANAPLRPQAEQQRHGGAEQEQGGGGHLRIASNWSG